MRTGIFIPLIWAVVCPPIVTGEEEVDRRPAKGIQDNSFLVEEAYNQEAGVVQHIFNLRRDINKLPGADERAWHFAFTQEWPVFSQTHQLSYTIPYSWMDNGSEKFSGIRDVLLNYRLQVFTETEKRPAFAPRVTLVFPTGDEDQQLGDGTLGFQFNLPVSKIIADRWTLHGNTGLTLLPDVNGRDSVSYNLAASVIFAPSANLNLMLEIGTEWLEEATELGEVRHDFSPVISPGLRYAFNLTAGQLVVGMAAPIGLTKSAPDYGLFFYLSFEHRFLAEKK